VLGERVEAALRDAGLSVQTIVLPGDDIVADEASLVHVLMRAAVADTCYLAVGSGTITDIARFASHRTRNRFISLPTAPSMDGYATTNNTLTLGGFKLSTTAHSPEAIFCDIETLAAAPRPMIAAGLGDTLAKFTSVNDLRLGRLLWTSDGMMRSASAWRRWRKQPSGAPMRSRGGCGRRRLSHPGVD